MLISLPDATLPAWMAESAVGSNHAGDRESHIRVDTRDNRSSRYVISFVYASET